MGNCIQNHKQSTADIAPSYYITECPVVKLYGSPTSSLTSYIRFALLCKNVSLHFLPAETLVIQCGSDTVSGSRETLLRYIDERFSYPPLMLDRAQFDQMTPVVVVAARLQHASLNWHMERLVRWAEDLAKRGGRRTIDPSVGSSRMEVRKLAKSYAQVLELLLEHAQMEERIVFPVLETADPELCRAANEEHARDLPIMNGIKEDIKSIGVLNVDSPVYAEALLNLFTRLKKLQKHCREHFEEEEKDLLPLLEAAETSKEQKESVLERCLEVMEATHSHLFRFFIEGLLPHNAMKYLDLISMYSDKERVASMLHSIVE